MRNLGEKVYPSDISDFLNEIILKNQYESFLEIGSYYGFTLEHVNCKSIVGVDPIKKFEIPDSITHIKYYEMYSDIFFKNNKTYFDLVYIDGDHSYTQVVNDLINTLLYLNEKGTIVLDDICPIDKISSMKDHEESLNERKSNNDSRTEWMGDVYKILFLLNNIKLKYNLFFIGGRYRLVFKLNSNLDKYKIIDSIKTSFNSTFNIIDNYEYEDLLINMNKFIVENINT